MHKRRGFTLIEVMVTVAIIAILAAIAVPNYTEYITRSRFAEAYALLADLRVRMEQHYMDNRRYSSTTGGGTCGIPGGNTPTMSSAKYFSYTCASSGANAAGDQLYTLTATGLAAQGLDGIAFTIDQGNTKATTVAPSPAAMAARGYVANTSCWVTRKPSQC